jgi:5-methylcytosine-specific restriction protein A
MDTKKTPTLLHPFDSNGKPIDASFSLEATENGFAILYASRGGTKGTPNARNSEYHIGLTAILSRLKRLDAVVTAILLDSIAARNRSLLERALEFPGDVQFPVRLAEIGDMDALRREISDAQKNVLAAPARNAKHGNRMRSIRILFELSKSSEVMPTDAIAQILIGDDAALPTADRGVLEQRVMRLKSRGSVPRPVGNRSPAARVSATVTRFVRSPVVAAYAIQRAAGVCELCGRTTFMTDTGAVFFEVHHLVHLSEGGPDTPCNTAALCPNCHRELHYGASKMRLIALLYERVPELQPVRFGSVPVLSVQVEEHKG